MIVVDDSLLQGTEAPICSLGRFVACQGLRSGTERLLMLVWPSEYYPLLLFHVCTDDTARGNLEYIKSDYMNLGMRVKGMGAQVVFYLILLMKGKGLRSGWILGINNWQHSWCC